MSQWASVLRQKNSAAAYLFLGSAHNFHNPLSIGAGQLPLFGMTLQLKRPLFPAAFAAIPRSLSIAAPRELTPGKCSDAALSLSDRGLFIVRKL
jgi:hypothetical protein